MAKHRRARSSRSPLRILLVMILVAAAAVTGYVMGDRSDDDTVVSSGETTSSTTSSDTTEVESSTPGSTAIESAVWPFVTSQTRYTDPVEAARRFVTEYLGFVNPTIGEFRQGDSRSGEVEARTKIASPTTVFVRLMSDSTWWVLGSATENIVVDVPNLDDAIASPVSVKGQARAFEGTVKVEVRQDGSEEPIGTGFVTGSGGADLGTFSGSITFSKPTQQRGAIVFLTESAEDGRVNEAGVIRIRFK